MRESSVFQHVIEPLARERYHRGREQGIHEGIQRGAEQGARATAIRNLLTALEHRFDGDAVHILRPTLEGIQDSHRLEELHREALRTESFEAFASALGATLDPLS